MSNQIGTLAVPAKRVAPSPPGDFLLGHLRYIRRDILGFVSECSKLGDIVALRVGPTRVHLLFDAEHVRHVLQDNAKNYEKGARAYRRLRATLGNGLIFNAGGDFWRRQRRIMAPAFHNARITKFVDIMATSSDEMVAAWKEVAAAGGTVDVATEMVKLTMQIVTRALFSSEVPEDMDLVRDALSVVVKYIDNPATSPWSALREALFGRSAKVEEALTTLRTVVDKIVADRRKSTVPHADLLGMLMDSRDEETGEALTDEQIRDELLSIFIAGHETTANVLTWSFYLLAKNPAIRDAFRADLLAQFKGRTPRLADIPQLGFAKRIFSEAMRLYPPVWMQQRNAIAEDEIGGVRIPAQGLVGLPTYVIHRIPAYFPNPEVFDPNRFLPEVEATRPKYAYIPFSGGPRICIGNTFALFEGQIILAALVQNFDLELMDPEEVVVPETLITMRPKGVVRMRVRSVGTGA